MGKGFLIPQGLLFVLGSSHFSPYARTTIPNNKSTASNSDFYLDYFGQVIWKNDDLPFNSSLRKIYSQEFKKTWKKVQPIRYAWEKNKNNKKTDWNKGIEATNLIRDYTFRFVNACLSGTIWILDYEIPKDGKYPTKFFFGTNAHVAEGIWFDNKNPYQQILPTNKECVSHTSLVFRETDLNYGGYSHFMRSSWKDNEKGFIEKEYPDNNVEKWLTEDTYEPPYYFYKTNDIKLVYVATDFAGKGDDPKWGWCGRKWKNYVSDFAVIEIDFKNEEIAKRMTRNFHNKYHHKIGTKRRKAIDFFAKPLMERKTNKQMYEESIDIFVAGHPSNGLKGRSVGSFNLEKNQASKLTYVSDWNMIKDSNNDEIIGHSNVCHINQHIDGFGTRRLFRGVEILLEHEPLQIGSSGSLTTDGERNAIGVKSRKWDKVSAVDVFRSPEIKYGSETTIPAYDLIEGVINNSDDRSYMDSIVTYIVNKGGKTNLSEMRKWGTKDSEALKPSKDRRSAKEIISPKKKTKKRSKI